MMKHMLRYIILITCFFLFSPQVNVSAQKLTIGKVLDALEKKYRGKSFTADLEQITTTTAIDLQDKYSGKVWFSHPGKMRWEYLSPQNHIFITNGKTLWFYIPEQNQVHISNAESFFQAGAGGAFLSDISLIKNNYSAKIKTDTDPYVIVELIPKKPVPQVSSIDLWIHRAVFEIHQAMTRNEYNDTTQLIFTNIKFTAIAPELFEFIPRNNMTIINENQNL